MYLGRQSSLPPSVSGNVKSSTTPRSQSSSAGPFPFHMSPSSGSLSYSTRSPNWFGHQSTVANPSGFSELHPSHPSHPSQPHTTAAGGGGGMPSSQSYHNIYRQVKHSPESGKKRFRSGSLAFNRTAGIYNEWYSYGIIIMSCSFAAMGQCFESQSLTGWTKIMCTYTWTSLWCVGMLRTYWRTIYMYLVGCVALCLCTVRGRGMYACLVYSLACTHARTHTHTHTFVHLQTLLNPSWMHAQLWCAHEYKPTYNCRGEVIKDHEVFHPQPAAPWREGLLPSHGWTGQGELSLCHVWGPTGCRGAGETEKSS